MTRNEFHQLCRSNLLILDGATGTELIKRGMPSGVSPEAWICEHPEAICAIHDAYIAAGSNIVYAPTFGGNRCKLAEFGLDSRQKEILSRLVSITKANAGKRAFVFGDIAPTGKFVEPFGDLPFEEAVAIYRECAAIMADAGADGFAIETMMDLQETRAALIGVKEAAPDLPVIVTMTFEASGRTLTGSTPESALAAIQALGADAFGCNCSTGPREMAAMVAKMRPFAKIPLVAKPNAGLPRLVNGRTLFSMSPEQFADCTGELVSSGAAILGGCCGTTPEHISALALAAKRFSVPERTELPPPAVSSLSQLWEIGKKFTVIGERINPTGKKAFQAELRAGSLDMALDFAIQQCSAGAQVLDVNMGLSGIDERAMMRQAVCELVKTVPVPLCIDSTNPETVEAALRIYPGRAMLNSISAEEKRLKEVLPIAAKYGAFIIALPLTDQGIPESAAERMETLDRIISAAAVYGYTVNDICVDALIMAVSTLPAAAATALEVISRCSARNINTVCGLSNVSFGLPDRPLLNSTFLGMAMGRNLTMAIANPLFAEIMNMVKAADALSQRDENMADYIACRTGAEIQSAAAAEKLAPETAVKEAVMRGRKERIGKLVNEALASGITPEKLLNDTLIPAIIEVGNRYEKKEFFLPQLLSAADAMSSATAILEPLMAKGGTDSGKKIRMIIATVKNDIHDIGKNIVISVLKNNGVEVVDLGKNVPPEVIISRAEAEGINIIGLSALMTDTMKFMTETVELARKRGLDKLKFIVGGAVVDSFFAEEIGAVYAADPMETLAAVRRLAECG